MNREEAEILVARYFEGDLSAAEKDALNKELASDRELASLFSDQDVAHRNLETLKLRWSLPADFAARVTENLPVLEKEKLVARYFDGDLSSAEKDQLKRELAQDRDLAALFSDQEIAHRDLETLKLRWTLPADFTSSVLAGLPSATEEREAAPVARIYSIHWKQVAMAASVAIVAGLIFTMSYVSQPLDHAPLVDDPISHLPPAAARAYVSTYSSGDVRVTGAGNGVADKSFKGDVILPAVISAPANSYAVVKVENGTAVLPKGAKARLAATNGRLTLEPIEGDLYLESDADGLVDASVSDVSVSVQKGGVTLRKQGEKYFAEPSHGQATLKGRKYTASVSAHEMQFGVISQDGAIEIQKGEGTPLADWAAAGRADELRRHVQRLFNIKIDDLNRWNEVIKAMAAQPAERARQAAFMQFMVEEKLLEQCSPEQQEAFGAIAKILAEGTTADDIGKDTRDAISMMHEMLKDEQTRQWVKFMIKGWFDDCGRISRGEAGHHIRRDMRGRGLRPPKDEPKEESKEPK
jgi:anti-sigma-K factor RskA